MNELALRCVCDGRYAGCSHTARCAEERGTSALWCPPCNLNRKIHISARLKELAETP